MSGVLAVFETRNELVGALDRVRAAGFADFETYTPEALDEGPSVLPLIILICGLLGFAASFSLLTYGDVWAYRLDIGGRPAFAWPAFIPIAFENGILAAVMGGFFGYFIVNRMPVLYEPIDELPVIRRAMRDLWCIAIRTDEPDRLRSLLQPLAPAQIEELPA